MKGLNLLFCLIIIQLIGFSEQKLKFVIDMIRHGARAPIWNIPFFKNITWPYPGELTTTGQRQHNLLGRYKRMKYIEGDDAILPQEYDPSLIYIRSTDVRRTIMSAQSYLLGLYPNGQVILNENQTKHTKDLLVPGINLTIDNEIIDVLSSNPTPFDIPMNSIITKLNSAEDLLLSNDCARLQQDFSDFYSSDKYRKIRDEKYAALVKSISKAYPQITEAWLKDGMNIYALGDFVMVADFDGKKPYLFSDQMMTQIKKFTMECMQAIHRDHDYTLPIEMNKLSQDMILKFNSSFDELNHLKYVLYSAHDFTLAFVITALQQFNSSIKVESVPMYASSLAFELHGPENSNEKSDHYVSVFLNGECLHNESYPQFASNLENTGKLTKTRKELCKLDNYGLEELSFRIKENKKISAILGFN